MADKPITLIATVTIKEGKEKRAEELWKAMHDDVQANEQGRVGFRLHYDGYTKQYIVVYDYASEKVRDEFMAKPFHLDVSGKVRAEGLMDREPDTEKGEVRWVTRVTFGDA